MLNVHSLELSPDIFDLANLVTKAMELQSGLGAEKDSIAIHSVGPSEELREELRISARYSF